MLTRLLRKMRDRLASPKTQDPRGKDANGLGAPPPAGPVTRKGAPEPDQRPRGTRKKGTPDVPNEGRVSSYPWKKRGS